MIKQNIIFTILFSALFILGELIFRGIFSEQQYLTKPSEYIYLLIIAALISIINVKILKSFLFIIFLFFTLQVLHFDYYGYFIFPIEIILFFTRQNEIYAPFISSLSLKSLFPLIVCLLTYLLTRYLVQKTIKRYHGKVGTIIFILAIIYPLIQIGVNFNKGHLGSRPNSNKSVIKNTMYVLTHFIGKTLPSYAFSLELIPSWNQSILNKREQVNIDYEVIFVLGESLSSAHLPFWGYHRNTTPFLSEIHKVSNSIYKQTFSSGVYTDTSIPMILNVAKKANAINHIISGNNNLFNLAKKSNLGTYFLSAQSEDSFSYIKNYLHPRLIDNYQNATTLGFSGNTLDHNILDYLKKSEVLQSKKKKFIILNMSGSHEPYMKKVPSTFQPFGTDSYIDQYDNTIAYTDLYLQKLYQELKESKKKYILIYTSDHGQHVTKKIMGKGNHTNLKHILVPTIFIPINTNIDHKLVNFLKNKKFINHYQLSLSIAHLLGFNSLPKTSENGLISFVIGGELSGNNGISTIKVKENSLKTNLPDSENITLEVN
jgi:glucan phosphoethanolaminetransferase (alkaline phosphatase superfamily)